MFRARTAFDSSAHSEHARALCVNARRVCRSVYDRLRLARRMSVTHTVWVRQVDGTGGERWGGVPDYGKRVKTHPGCQHVSARAEANDVDRLVMRRKRVHVLHIRITVGILLDLPKLFPLPMRRSVR